jgi:drug/metabolite transporter (DMT)-like permease
MKPADVLELVVLAAIWGASFLFMRVATPEFGAWALVWVRVASAAVLLMPLVAQRGEFGALRRHWRAVVVMGVVASAAPFVLFAYAALSIQAGLSAILNATTPLWTAALAVVWLREPLTRERGLGLLIGFASVTWLAWDQASFRPGGSGWAVLACLGATLLYGLGAHWTRRHLAGVPSIATAAGTQAAAAVTLTVPGLLLWPAQPPSTTAWSMALTLGILCSAVALILYFRLIRHVGPTQASTVTFLIPAFAVLWGVLFLDEQITSTLIGACLGIVAGTSLVLGLWPRRH